MSGVPRERKPGIMTKDLEGRKTGIKGGERPWEKECQP